MPVGGRFLLFFTKNIPKISPGFILKNLSLKKLAEQGKI